MQDNTNEFKPTLNNTIQYNTDLDHIIDDQVRQYKTI